VSSTGQIIGGVVGAFIGFFAGNPMLGASIGMAIGGAIDPPKGPKIEGPRITDLSVQTATYGAPIPIVKGAITVFGNIFWLENNALKETKTTEEQGGKGGGGQEVTTYSYSATFALGLCLAPVDSIGRIWCSGKLIADYRQNNLSGVLASGFKTTDTSVLGDVATSMFSAVAEASSTNIRFYNGGPSQQPDPRMQAALGVANTPAYRGLAYIVFEDFQLADYGNSLMSAQIKVEILSNSTIDQYNVRTNIYTNVFPPIGTSNTDGPYNPIIKDSTFQCDKEQTKYTISFDGRLIKMESNGCVAPGVLGEPGEPYYVGTTSGNRSVYYINDVSGTLGYLYVGGVRFASKLAGTYELQAACVGTDGNLYLQQYKGGQSVLEKYDGNDLSLIWTAPAPELPYNLTEIAFPILPGMSACIAVNDDGTKFWWFSIAGQVIDLRYMEIAPNGDLTHKYSYTGAEVGSWYAHTISMAATGMLCAITSNQGRFTLLDSTPIMVPQNVTLSEIVSSLCLQSNLITASDIDVTALTQIVRGYKITSTAAIRSALEPLRACWPFDVVQRGYKLKFIPRGGSSIATVSNNDLGALSGENKEPIRLTTSREMDTQLPRRVETTFIDADREYDTGAGPGTERLNTDAVNILQIDLPVVLTADEAAAVEQTLLYLYWMERNDLTFTLPPTYQNLEPADVITINTKDASYTVRLVSTQYLPDGRVECSAKYNHSPVYVPIASADTGSSTGQVLSYNGPTLLYMLDIPCISSNYMDASGILSAATGIYDSWPGASLLKTDDNGNSYSIVDNYLAPGSIVGYATNTIGTSNTPHTIDASNKLNIRLINGEILTISELQMYNGGNHFAYGTHGRWEIIAAQTVTEETDGTFTLQNLLRGRFGTEHAMASHAISDTLILLNQSLLRFSKLDISNVNMLRSWRAVTRGALLDSVTDIPFTYTGVNLECLSPIDLNGNRTPSTNDWTVTWTRRSRTATELFSGVNPPLGESSESYDVEVWDRTYTTLKRTFSSLTSANLSYTSAQQITDFGAYQKVLYLKVYQNSTNLGRGYPLVSSILREVNDDAYIYDVSILMHMDDTGLTDVKGKTATLNGTVVRSNLKSKFGGYSAYFDGNGDYISFADHADFALGNTFTLEAWVYCTSFATEGCIFSQSLDGYAGEQMLYITTSAFVGFTNNPTGGTWLATYAPKPLQLNTWHHVALTCNNGKATVFLDGIGGTPTNGMTWVDRSTQFLVGATRIPYYSAYKWMTGYIDEARVTKGVSRYNSNFVPPTTPFYNT